MIHNIDYQNSSKCRNGKVGSNNEEQDLKGQKGAVCSESTLFATASATKGRIYCIQKLGLPLVDNYSIL